ncbi:UNVERIFIED_CONTAM: hypothetical protein HDU68_004980 [Siphonaria sp. JEL0065]|nr:hypothetical protein HDU68_004980 [Siphonaria sp. JEL0065]
MPVSTVSSTARSAFKNRTNMPSTLINSRTIYPFTVPQSATTISASPTHQTKTNTPISQPIYLFAYGSLINPLSLKRTIGRQESAVPVRVAGFKRWWGFNCTRRSYTAVSIAHTGRKEDMVNGVLIPVTNTDLISLDEREAGYLRKQISLKDVAAYNSDLSLQNVIIYAYLLEDDVEYDSDSSTASSTTSHVACPRVPIPQSYVDCILIGALLEHGHAFAKDFVEWTQGWHSGHWINDRYAPHDVRRYVPNTQAGESDVAESLADSVDSLLYSLIPKALEARVPV